MQELIEKIEKLYLIKQNKNSYKIFRQLELEALEKEKEQICNAYTDGLEGPYIGAEEYYNQTYNKKQIIIDIMKEDEDDGLYNQNK